MADDPAIPTVYAKEQSSGYFVDQYQGMGQVSNIVVSANLAGSIVREKHKADENADPRARAEKHGGADACVLCERGLSRK